MTDRIALAPGRGRIRLTVKNTVESRDPGVLALPVLADEPDGWSSTGRPRDGSRLDVPAGASVRFAPGETKDVVLVAIRG